MKVTLRNIKTYEQISNETDCFQATLYVNGKKIGVVSNSGNGGSNRFEPDMPNITDNMGIYRDLCKYCAEQEAVHIPNFGDIDMCIDQYISQLLEQIELEKYYRSLCKKNVCFRLKGDDDDTVREVNLSKKVALEYIENKYGDNVVEILNEKWDKTW